MNRNKKTIVITRAEPIRTAMQHATFGERVGVHIMPTTRAIFVAGVSVSSARAGDTEIGGAGYGGGGAAWSI